MKTSITPAPKKDEITEALAELDHLVSDLKSFAIKGAVLTAALAVFATGIVVGRQTVRPAHRPNGRDDR